MANGLLAASELIALATNPGHRLATAAAAAWDALNNEYRRLHGSTLALTDSYRTFELQKRIFLERYKPAKTGTGRYGDVRVWQGVRYVRMSGAAAAVPGTSNHGIGKALDVTNLGGFSGGAYKRLAELAPRFGFSNANGKKINEPWHWEYVGGGSWFRDITPIQRAIHATPDNVWGPDTEKRIQTLRAASRLGGGRFPYGKAFAQDVVGATQDNSWGPKSSAAHDAAVKEIQRALGLVVDGKYGPKTDAAIDAARDAARRG